MRPFTADDAEGWHAIWGDPEVIWWGESESFEFVADAAGEYHLVCYVAGHSAVGMWMFFNVSSDGSAGVQGA